jgi:hypothetical protein
MASPSMCTAIMPLVAIGVRGDGRRGVAIGEHSDEGRAVMSPLMCAATEAAVSPSGSVATD